MIKAAVISLGSKSSKWVYEAMSKYFEKVDELDIREIEVSMSGKELEILHSGKKLDKYDGIYLKGSFRYLPILATVSSALYDKVFMPIKPEAFTIGHNKLLTHISAQKFNIPMPKTYVAATVDAGKKLLEKITYPIVFKFPEGTQGKGVMFADSFASASSLIDALEALKQPIIIQEYIETDGVDTRAIVVGDKVIAAMQRRAEKGEKRSNIHAGGKGEACVLDARTQKIAIETAKAVGAEICGVDMLEGPKGPVVIEINLSPGLQGITDATKVDVAGKIAEYIYKKTKAVVEAKKSTNPDELFKDLGIEKSDTVQEKINNMIVNAEFRGERIILPKIVTNVSKLTDSDEMSVSVSKGKVIIKKI